MLVDHDLLESQEAMLLSCDQMICSKTAGSPNERFAANVGQLAGNPFLTITEGLHQLPQLGRMVLWQGAQDVSFEVT